MNRSPAADVTERYPLATQVLRRPIEGRKRKTLLVAIAAFQDEGHEPSIRDLLVRTKLAPVNGRYNKSIAVIDALLKRLENDGLLRVEWAPMPKTGKPHVRNRYEVLID